MNKLTRMLRAALTALTAGLIAGCTACFAVRALGFTVSWTSAYPAAAAAAAVVGLSHRGTGWAIGAAAAVVLALGAAIVFNISGISLAAREFAVERTASPEFFEKYASAAAGGALILGILLGALTALLLRAPSGVPVALTLLIAAVLCALTLNQEISIWRALPGLAAGLAAFGLPDELRRSDGMRPALLLPALTLAVLAVLLTPSARITWAPLENLAERIRAVVDDYVRFTEQRVAFSIAEKGYDHAGMLDDRVVAMLGGPANPTEDEAMKVTTDRTLLLRGTVRRSYTGYSWVDDLPKARYLYYDFTHRAMREDAFGTGEVPEGFAQVDAEVEMLETGTSTLFVPAHMSEFSMDLANAVYYNSAGEIFLTRQTQAGDRYALSAAVPENPEALIRAAEAVQDSPDQGFAAAVENYAALPEGIDSRVYALAVELTQGSGSAVRKAYAIQNYLAQNYRYTLDGRYPEQGQDFVSWFLLEEKQGYCSYFATAMTVLCRVAGVPARYVEGYYVQAQPGGETLITGKNAHAWVEVYLNGLGWTAFDPTARAVEMSQGDSEQGDAGDNGGADASGVSHDGGDETPFENDDTAQNPDTNDTDLDASGDGATQPDGQPDTPPEDQSGDSAGDTPQDDQSDDQPNDQPDNQPDNQPDDQPNDQPDDQPQQRDRDLTWLWILLACLLLAALIALAILWLKRRVEASDPVKLAAQAGSADAACLLLYRAILTLLSRCGLTPRGGETPQAFAARVVQAMPNPDYEAFAAAVAHMRYSDGEPPAGAANAGRRAYLAFLGGMKKGERLRYELRRALSGNGDMENIP